MYFLERESDSVIDAKYTKKLQQIWSELFPLHVLTTMFNSFPSLNLSHWTCWIARNLQILNEMICIHCISLNKFHCFKAHKLSGHQEMFNIILWCVHCIYLYTCIFQSNGKLFNVHVLIFYLQIKETKELRRPQTTFIMRSLRNRCADSNQFFMCVLIGNHRRPNYREILKDKNTFRAA